MADARTAYVPLYVIAAIVVVAASILCHAGQLSAESWLQTVLTVLAMLGAVHMPSPGELARRVGPVLVAFGLLGGCEGQGHVTMRWPGQAKSQVQTATVSPLGGTAIDYAVFTPRLSPSSPGKSVIYSDSQTGKIRMLSTTGDIIEAGMADKVKTFLSAPLAPIEGSVYTNTTSHKLFFWDGTAWQEIGQLVNQVPSSRQILTTAPLSGGGDLTMDRNLSLVLTPSGGLQVSGGGLAALFGTTLGTVTQGNDTRLPPTPSAPGSIIYDTGLVYASNLPGTTSDVLRGGPMPTWGPIPAAAIPNTTVVAGSYPIAGQISTFTVGADGRLTAASSTQNGAGLINIQAATALSGIVPIANGGTNSGTALSNNRAMVSSGGAIVESAAGTMTTVLHGTSPPSFSAVSLTADVTNTLPIANGGTNSAAALLNNRVMLSSGGSIVESNACTASQVLVGGTPPACGIAPKAAGGFGQDVSTGLTNGHIAHVVANAITIGAMALTDLVAHASTHLPSGSDPLTTAAAVDTGTANSAGSANSFARSDHVHRDVILQTAEFHLTADFTTTSGSAVDITGATTTVTTQASTKLAINCSFSTSNTSALGATTNILLDIDGATDSGVAQTFPALANSTQGASFARLKTGLSAASHTVKLRIFTSAGTARIRPSTAPNSEHASCYVQETRL